MLHLRPAERLLLGYFGYSVVLAWFLSADWRLAALWAGAAGLLLLGAISGPARPATSVVRDLLPLPLILGAYWQMDWVRGGGDANAFARRWLPLDRWLLAHAHAPQWGTLVSVVLETAYLLTYAIPPACVGILYVLHRADRIDRFYAVFFSGTLAAYALLPFFPSASPRLIDPAGWQPSINAVRALNIRILDNLDIRSSVCPSGHVASAFAAAIGLFAALPERKAIAAGAMVLALLIAVETVYGRYHYAVDAAASMAIVALTSAAVGRGAEFRSR